MYVNENDNVMRYLNTVQLFEHKNRFPSVFWSRLATECCNVVKYIYVSEQGIPAYCAYSVWMFTFADQLYGMQKVLFKNSSNICVCTV